MLLIMRGILGGRVFGTRRWRMLWSMLRVIGGSSRRIIRVSRGLRVGRRLFLELRRLVRFGSRSLVIVRWIGMRWRCWVCRIGVLWYVVLSDLVGGCVVC